MASAVSPPAARLPEKVRIGFPERRVVGLAVLGYNRNKIGEYNALFAALAGASGPGRVVSAEETVMPVPLRLLILEDHPDDAELMVYELCRAGFEPDWRRVETETDYLAQLHEGLDLILADYTLPRFNALDALRLLQERGLDVPFIVVTGTIGEEAAVECMRKGAADYLLKDRLARLGAAVANALQKKRLRDEKRQMEEALRESEEEFRSVVEHSHAGILIVDDAYRFVYVNDELCHILGYPREEIVGQDFRQFLDDESRHLVADRYVRRRRGENVPHRYEFNVVRKDGEKRRVEISSTVITDSAGNVRTVAQILDITERERAEEALHRYVERLKTLREIDRAILAAQSPEEIAQAALTRIRQLVPCQRASVALFDLKAGEATVLAVHVNDTTRIGAGMRIPLEEFQSVEKLRQGKAYVVDDILSLTQPGAVVQALRAEGVRSYVGVPLVVRGEAIGSLNVGTDRPGAFSPEHVEIACEVADQLAVAIQNARLLEAERRRRAELEALRQASLRLTSSLELHSVLEAILAHTLQLVSADDAHIFLYDGERLTFGAALWAGGFQREPYAEPRPEGLTYTVARSGEPVVVPDVDDHPLFEDWRWGGAIIGLPLRVGDRVVGVMNIAFERPHDFSVDELNILQLLADQAAVAIANARLHERVRSHAEELAAALAQLRELDRLKSEFIQNVSHELRLPLTLIRGYAELLTSGELGELHPQQEGPLGIIARRARMLAELVENMTLILGAEARSMERGPVALDELVHAAVEDFRIAAEQAMLTLRAEIAPDLPPVGGETVYLRRVVDNLLNNAVKFTAAGGMITVRMWQEEDQVVLQVADTGIGIPPDRQERIFERFYQVNGSLRRRYGGVGLGLALVKEVVELLGGKVGVESEVGCGSTFTVTLPICDGQGTDRS